MITEHLTEIFERDLNLLKKEILAYDKESDLWVLKNGIKNSAGTLCLHIIGNLKHFIGAIIGGSGYIRDRVGEFENRDIPREKIVSELEETLEIVKEVLYKMGETDLAADFPEGKFHKPIKTQHLLIHLTTHLTYHLGQINYHRRLL